MHILSTVPIRAIDDTYLIYYGRILFQKKKHFCFHRNTLVFKYLFIFQLYETDSCFKKVYTTYKFSIVYFTYLIDLLDLLGCFSSYSGSDSDSDC